MFKIFRQNFFVSVLISAIVWIAFSLYGVLDKKAELKKEIVGTEANIENLRKINDELSAALDYLGTDSYLEKEAKESFNLQKLGEKVIIINRKNDFGSGENDNQDGPSAEKDENVHSRWTIWWNYFFSRKYE